MVPLTYGADSTQKDRKRNMPTTAIVAVVAVLAVVVLSGLYLYGALPWLFDEDPRYSHSFSLTIDPNSTSEFLIICPVPVNASGSPCPMFVEELEVTSGAPNCLPVDNEHGCGLQVSGQGYTRLHWEGDWGEDEGDWYLNLSMTNAPSSWDYDTPDEGFWSWIYSSNETLGIRLSYSAEQIHNETPRWLSGGGPGFYISLTTTEEGWCQAFLDYGWSVIN
jgi:hypothetical protein